MTTGNGNQGLKFVQTAVEHATAFAVEAAALGLVNLARDLRAEATALAADLVAVHAALGRAVPTRDQRQLAANELQCAYDDARLRFASSTPAADAAHTFPGGHLEVAERVRFSLRHLPRGEVASLLRAALTTYEAAVDAYLTICAEIQVGQGGAIHRSQLLRQQLERAKVTLLAAADTGGPAWKRIKARAVRTKRAGFAVAAAAGVAP